MSESQPPLKKRTILVRVESEMYDHYKNKARGRRVPVAQVVREVLYEDMEKEQRNEHV